MNSMLLCCLGLIDVLCGIIVVVMLLVNNFGDWSVVFVLLCYLEWYGCMLIDLVFLFFLFLVGVLMVFSVVLCVQDVVVWFVLVCGVLECVLCILVVGVLLYLLIWWVLYIYYFCIWGVL